MNSVSINRFANFQQSLNLFQALFFPTLWICVWMSLLRVLFFYFILAEQFDFSINLIEAFFVGIRFDILVLGFFWIPVFVLTLLWSLFQEAEKIFVPLKIYWVLLVLLILDLSWVDLFWFASRGDRLNHELFQVNPWVALSTGWLILGAKVSWLVTIVMTVSGLMLTVLIFKAKMQTVALPSHSKLQITGKLFLVFLMIALAARGTWTPHHLNIEHAQVSDNSLINKIPLNPVWNLDK